jgi:hypothetical protein
MLMKLNRDYVMVTDAGLSYGFTKGVPMNIPHRFVQKAMDLGAEPVEDDDKSEAAMIQKETDAEVVAAAKRSVIVKAAIKKMMEDNMSGDFTAGGRPNLRRLGVIVGFEVERAEVETWFDEVKAELAAA